MAERSGRTALLAGIVLLAGCGGAAQPVAIETGTPCAFCRMTIMDARVAAEIVAPGEEARQYDDIGCLVEDVKQRPVGADGRAFVADYQTGALIAAGEAVYTKMDAIATPMSSHLVAHATAAGRDADSRVRGGVRLGAAAVFGAAGAPGAGHAR